MRASTTERKQTSVGSRKRSHHRGEYTSAGAAPPTGTPPRERHFAGASSGVVTGEHPASATGAAPLSAASHVGPYAPTELLSTVGGRALATSPPTNAPDAPHAPSGPLGSIGKVLLGRYELLSVRGRGGMGVVFDARDLALQRLVVVKVLPPDHAHDPRAAARLVREARVAAQVNHPAIVSILDVGTLETGEPYLVMERLIGHDLAECLGTWGAISLDDALAILEPLADALEHLHAVGIVHRDVKPANVFVLEGAPMRVKLLDFGLALLDDAAYVRLTQRGIVVGTAEYLAPEIARGAPATPSSDIYSLASVAYELLAGRPPFDGNPLDILASKARDAPPRLDASGQIDRAVADVVARGMSIQPQDRPMRPTDLTRALAATREVVAPTASTVHLQPAARSFEEAPIELPPNPTLMRGTMVFLALLAATIIGLAVWVL